MLRIVFLIGVTVVLMMSDRTFKTTVIILYLSTICTFFLSSLHVIISIVKQLARYQHIIGVFNCDVIMSSPYQLLDIHVLLEMVDFNMLLLWDIHSCKTNQKYYISIYPWFTRYIYTVISWCLINGRKQTFYLWPRKK